MFSNQSIDLKKNAKQAIVVRRSIAVIIKIILQTELPIACRLQPIMFYDLLQPIFIALFSGHYAFLP